MQYLLHVSRARKRPKTGQNTAQQQVRQIISHNPTPIAPVASSTSSDGLFVSGLSISKSLLNSRFLNMHNTLIE